MKRRAQTTPFERQVERESMEQRITQNLIAPCGMNCGICKAHLRAKNPCHGCREAQENKPKTRVNCRLRVCIKRTGKFCCHCPDFPCDRLRHLDHRYRTKYGMSEIENLEFIRKNGIRKFVTSERQRWISARGVVCVHDKKHYGWTHGTAASSNKPSGSKA